MLICSVFGAASLADGRIVVFGGEIDPSDQGHAGAGDFSDATLVFDTKVRSNFCVLPRLYAKFPRYAIAAPAAKLLAMCMPFQNQGSEGGGGGGGRAASNPDVEPTLVC